MARAIVTSTERQAAYEPLYDIDPHTGATIEIFFADRVLAKSFGARSAGWFHWFCQRGYLPSEPRGPFPTSYLAYRDAMGGGNQLFVKEPFFQQ